MGKLKRGDKYYWVYKENILKELDLHIKKHGTVNGLGVVDNLLHTAICKNKHCIPDLVKELGYNFEDLSKYYIDNRGDYNASMGEVYVSNWLIAQGYKDYYDRNIIINKDNGNYNSDFRMITNDGRELRIEVWGYSENDHGYYKDEYMKARHIKENLYKKYENSMILISVEQSDLINIKKMQDKLYDKLGKYLSLPFKKIEWIQIKCYDDMTEEEVVSEIMKHSVDGKFPTRRELTENAGSRLYTYIMKIGGLSYLAQKYNYEMARKSRYWNEDTVIEKLIYMHDTYGKFLKNSELSIISKSDKLLVGFLDYTKVNKGLMYWKIRLCEYLLTNRKKLSLFNEIKYLKNTVVGKNRIDNNRTREHKQLAQQILDEFNIK